MHDAGRYIYAVFMCQQAIEKALKGLITHTGGETLPIHSLRRLAEMANVVGDLEERQLMKLDFLSQYYINARYKEDLAELSKGISESVSKDFIDFSNETIQWLSQKMK